MRKFPSKRRDFIIAALASDTDECILWPFAVRASSGYGVHGEGRKNHDVHRFVCWAAWGDAPEGSPIALHACDNRLCVNPRHLAWGSQLRNMVEMSVRGRAVGGGKHRPWSAKTRAAVLASTVGLVKTARKLGVNPRHVAKIRRGARNG